MSKRRGKTHAQAPDAAAAKTDQEPVAVAGAAAGPADGAGAGEPTEAADPVAAPIDAAAEGPGEDGQPDSADAGLSTMEDVSDGEAERLQGAEDTAAPGQRDPDGQEPQDAAPAEPVSIAGVEVRKETIAVTLSDGTVALMMVADLPMALATAGDNALRAYRPCDDKVEWPELGVTLSLADIAVLSVDPATRSDTGAAQVTDAYTTVDGERVSDITIGLDGPSRIRMADPNLEAAAGAASIVFGSGPDRLWAALDPSWLDPGDKARPAASAAAAFLRKHPSAGADAARIELTRKKISQPLDTPRARLAFDVFADVLRRLDRLDEVERFEAEAAEKAKARTRPVLDQRDAALMPRGTFSR